MTDLQTITDTVNAVFDTVDAKDWPAARELFADEVDVDFSSLAGGGPARVTADQLIAGWQAGLHARKASWHLVGHHRIVVDGETATVALKGQAWNRLDEELGGGLFETWGRYELRLRRVGPAWLVDGFVYESQLVRGSDAVRSHTL
ncbi:nuclear transport factor 2 family protein [Longispora sp. K20-0274]|uniref:nuclear transport factor 2 family protein n=1 Tax=Longispora sp. K20-0274 TaxID=3088255 RepID=UPI00399AC174